MSSSPGFDGSTVGPDRGGRSIGVAGSDARPLEYFFGATGGGLWKTTDGGTNWQPVTDGKITSASVGAVAVCEADPDVLYIGTGETQIRGNIQQGDGIYKSTDGGTSWSHLGLGGDPEHFSNQDTPRQTATQSGLGHSVSIPHPTQSEASTSPPMAERVGGRSSIRDDRSGVVDISVHPDKPEHRLRGSLGSLAEVLGNVLRRTRQWALSEAPMVAIPGPRSPEIQALPQEGLIGKSGGGLAGGPTSTASTPFWKTKRVGFSALMTAVRVGPAPMTNGS